MHGLDFQQLKKELCLTKYGPPSTEKDRDYHLAPKTHLVMNARAENIIDYERFSILGLGLRLKLGLG